MIKTIFSIITILCIVMLPKSALADGERSVFVSILPQKYFVQQICRDRVKVEVMVQPGASPHTYEPKASQMTKLASSAAFFAVGVSFEAAWLDKIAAVNPKMIVVKTDANVPKIAMLSHHHDDGEDGQGNKTKEGPAVHTEEGSPDPHIWLSPSLVKMLVKAMSETLIDLYPDQAAFFTRNTDDFLVEIDNLDTQLRAILQSSQGKQFMVFHPSWGYFAREYGLEQVPVEIEGKQPKPAQLQELVEHARSKGIRVIFAQPQLSVKSAKIIAREIGGEVFTADPLAENWAANLLDVAGKIKQVVK